MTPPATTLARNAALRRDPTQTVTLRREYARAHAKRFRFLKGAVRDGVDRADVFGIGEDPPSRPVILQERPEVRETLNRIRRQMRELQRTASVATGAARAEALSRMKAIARSFVETPGRFAFPSSAAKLEAFGGWLNEMVDVGIMEVTRTPGGAVASEAGWQQTFVRRAYVKGVSSASTKLRQAGLDVSPRFDDVERTLSLPVHQESLELLFARNLEELRGITAEMSTTIRRELAQGFAEGINPRDTAVRINRAVDGIGIRRSRTLARTETIRAHSEATLNRFRQFGIEQVQGRAEFATAGDERVSNARWSVIETEDGSKPIQRIRPGERVWTRKGLREVVATSVRPYSGGLVRISVGHRSEVCTVEHPVWTCEEGWLEAGEIEAGHTVETFDDGLMEVTGLRHFQVGNADDRESLLLQVLRLPFVGLRALLVPVYAVHLKGDIEVREQEVDDEAPELNLLSELKAKVDEAVSNDALRRGLGFALSVARNGAEAASRLLRRLNPERFSAVVADDVVGGATTLFGAVATVQPTGLVRRLMPELVAAPAALSPLTVPGFHPAVLGAEGVAVGARGFDGKLLATSGAGFGGTSFVRLPSGIAVPRAEAVGSVAAEGAEAVATPLARLFRKLPAPVRVALMRAEDVARSVVLSGVRSARELVSAVVTDQVERHWYNLRRLGHITARKVLGAPAPVYNLQVEGPEEYYSSGILVKNCPICLGLEGEVFTLKEARGVIPVHPLCRCTWLPIVPGASSTLRPGQVRNADRAAAVLRHLEEVRRATFPDWLRRAA